MTMEKQSMWLMKNDQTNKTCKLKKENGNASSHFTKVVIRHGITIKFN